MANGSSSSSLYLNQIPQGDPHAILEEFKEVFQGLGCLNYEYDIKIDANVPPVVHPPRRVPFALRSRLKAQLQKMEAEGVIAPVEEPTPWVNSLVVVKKPNGSLRVCIDPRDLNKAILREHYPMKTVEEVTGQLSSAKMSSVLDASQAYYQIKVSEASSNLLCLNSPFGRWKFLRMPYGIKSGSELYQRVASQIFDGLEGVEVIMDDVLIWGRTLHEHNARLRAALTRVKQNNLTLNRDKCKVGVKQVLYVGHVLTDRGLKSDDRKVQAIVDMPAPTNKAELQRFLGMVNYVGKFIPNLSTCSEPLRQLLNKDVVWHLDEKHAESIQNLKKALTRAPVLAYFDPEKPVTVQVDSSSYGLGACVMQEGKPVAYASRSLNDAERNYSQLEKEMLAITWVCGKFHDYIYGVPGVLLESDHKPLESLFQKPLVTAPQRIQRMMLRVQKYDLHVRYRPGKEMFIADTLSRAPANDADSDGRWI